jgi:hypothetical protein
MVKFRGLFQRTACHHQTSPIAGTSFASTKLSLRTWFRANLAAMLPRLCWAAVRTTPMPYRLLKLAEVYA